MKKATPFTPIIISLALLYSSCGEKKAPPAGLPQVPEGYTVEVAAG
ncbi:MAG TPA: hypothetical protein PLR74_14960 [Agriterribacter sp.]|nr:hypothetical protein [Agriterribacter sp.]